MGILEEHRERKKKLLKATGEYWDERHLLCPYCAEEIPDVWDLNIQPDDMAYDVECYSCNKDFKVRANICYSARRLR